MPFPKGISNKQSFSANKYQYQINTNIKSFFGHWKLDRIVSTLSSGNWIFKRGFTLIETVVVLGILTFVMGSALVLITNILKGHNQTRINAEVKQAGQVVLDSLESQIRNAVNVTPSGVTSSINIEKADGTHLFIGCSDPTPAVNPTSNGFIGTSPDGLNYRNNPLTNLDPITGVSISGCSTIFTVVASSPSSPGLVTISFTISQGVAAPSRKDFEAIAPFRTTISLRNYQ